MLRLDVFIFTLNMTIKNTQRLAYNPTIEIRDAILTATIDLIVSQTYTGDWSRSDTVRYLVKIAHEPHSYPLTSQRTGLTSSSVTEDEEIAMKQLSPKFEKEPQTRYILRVLVSSLIQLGYLRDTKNHTTGN